MFSKQIETLFRLSAVWQATLLLVLFSAISVAAWGGTYILVAREMHRPVDARLSVRMEEAVAALDAGLALPTPQPGETADFVDDRPPEGFASRDAEGTNDEMRYLVQTTAYGRLRLGEDTERLEELRQILAGGMQISLMATLVLTATFGLWMARRSQDRLNTINKGLADVARGDLSTRITLEGQDDLSLLADRINVTSARLETVMTQMRVQSSNIAHDLRTPLARLRAQIETSLNAAEERGKSIDPNELETALEQIDQITNTFEALLRLARIESGAGRNAFRPVALEGLVGEITETYGPVVEEAHQTLHTDVQDPQTIHGDHDMLVQLLANLIQNALRHGAQNQTISLQVYGTRLIVTDQGRGIPVEDRENVLQPLHQGEATRQKDGFGLGLSMVRAICELHDAELTLSDGPNSSGLCVTVSFPKLTEL